MKILLVDDDQMMLLSLRKMLEENGYEVSSTVDSVEALKIISDEKVDLIISDIMMPCISGFTLLSMLKNFYYSKIPLIFMSAYNQDNVILRAYGLGASDFVSKPVDYKQLLLKIEEHSNYDEL